jgi:hypothetical protein
VLGMPLKELEKVLVKLQVVQLKELLLEWNLLLKQLVMLLVLLGMLQKLLETTLSKEEKLLDNMLEKLWAMKIMNMLVILEIFITEECIDKRE